MRYAARNKYKSNTFTEVESEKYNIMKTKPGLSTDVTLWYHKK